MTGSFTFRNGIGGMRQTSGFQNATQTTLGDDARSISIAVTPAFPDGIDIHDATAVEAAVRAAMQPLVDAGYDIAVEYGPFN